MPDTRIFVHFRRRNYCDLHKKAKHESHIVCESFTLCYIMRSCAEPLAGFIAVYFGLLTKQFPFRLLSRKLYRLIETTFCGAIYWIYKWMKKVQVRVGEEVRSIWKLLEFSDCCKRAFECMNAFDECFRKSISISPGRHRRRWKARGKAQHE